MASTQPVQIQVFGDSHQGLIREENEDSFLVDESHGVYAVADGLGGLPGGAEASQLAIKTLLEIAEQTEGEIPFVETFTKIHEAVVAEGDKISDEIGIGTTLTAVQVVGNRLRIGHVGDTGVFLFRNNKCEILTRDHTMAQDMLDRMDPDDNSPIPEYFHHTLTRCVGQTGEIETDTSEHELLKGDRIMIYSDGVTKTWEPHELMAGINLSDSPESLVQQIIRTANDRGGPDNVTVVILFVE